MDLSEILQLDRRSLCKYLHALGQDIDDSSNSANDVEYLQSLLLSCFPCQFEDRKDDVGRLLEIAVSYGVPFDMVNILFESNSGSYTKEIFEQIGEISSEISLHTQHIFVNVDNKQSLSPSTTQLELVTERSLILTYTPSSAMQSVHCVLFDPYQQLFRKNYCVLSNFRFGFYLLEVTISDNNERNMITSFLCTSTVYKFVSILDDTLDLLHWGWVGGWTEELESALMELLVAVNDEFVEFIRKLNSLISMMGSSSGQDDLNQTVKIVLHDLQKALCEHSILAVGRLHQTLSQFLDMESSFGGMMQFPVEFIQAVQSFIRAKICSSPQEPLLEKLTELRDAASSLLFTVQHKNPGNVSQISSLQRFSSCMDNALGNSINNSSISGDGGGSSSSGDSDKVIVTLDVVHAVSNLVPRDQMFDSAFSTSSIEDWNSHTVSYLPLIPMEYLEDTRKLDIFAMQLSQTLLMETINIGSMLGFRIELGQGSGDGSNNLATSAAIISCLLDCGLTYATTASGILIASLATNRSMLKLLDVTSFSHLLACQDSSHEAIPPVVDVEQVPLPKPLMKRLKDMPRIFRNKVKRPLSFRINSDLTLAVQKLRQHHGGDDNSNSSSSSSSNANDNNTSSGECWVGPKLEAVWRLMTLTSPPTLVVFELWYGDEMIAADFGHPTNGGKTFYIATRFFDRSESVKQLQPGFMLALIEIAYLRKHGCMIWDLGGYNLCPIMRYKLDLTGTPLSRPESMTVFRLARGTKEIRIKKESGNSVSYCTPIPIVNIGNGICYDNISPGDIE